MLFLLFALMVILGAVVVWALSINTDPVLTEAQLGTEAQFRDESGKNQTFPRLIDGTKISKATRHLSVVIPAYNERDRLPGMLRDAIDTLTAVQKSNKDYTWEIIVVDDGSKDKIEEVVAPFVKQVTSDKLRLMHLAVNQGKGGAVRKGALVARGQYIYMADADLAATAAELAKLEAGLARLPGVHDDGGYGIAVGSRSHLKDDSVAKRKW
jgi:dolichyl-phosphate beta-glucosyltransferase